MESEKYSVCKLNFEPVPRPANAGLFYVDLLVHLVETWYYLAGKDVGIMNNNLWDVWEAVHEMPDQEKRISSAQKAACTPMEIDRENRCGKFQGSSGSYLTTLEKCKCGDFLRRQLPCKHMYRLAIELELVDRPALSDTTKIKLDAKNSFSLNESVSKVEQLSNDSQILLKDFLLEHLFRKAENVGSEKNEHLDALLEIGILIVVDDPIVRLSAIRRNDLNARMLENGLDGFKKNMSHPKLVQWCVDNAADKISMLCPEIQAVTLAPAYRRSIRKVYTYLLRKFDYDLYIDPEIENELEIPKGATFLTDVTDNGTTQLELSFPDDEVTKLLDQYGANRCTSWNENK